MDEATDPTVPDFFPNKIPAGFMWQVIVLADHDHEPAVAEIQTKLLSDQSVYETNSAGNSNSDEGLTPEEPKIPVKWWIYAPDHTGISERTSTICGENDSPFVVARSTPDLIYTEVSRLFRTKLEMFGLYSEFLGIKRLQTKVTKAKFHKHWHFERPVSSVEDGEVVELPPAPPPESTANPHIFAPHIVVTRGRSGDLRRRAYERADLQGMNINSFREFKNFTKSSPADTLTRDIDGRVFSVHLSPTLPQEEIDKIGVFTWGITPQNGTPRLRAPCSAASDGRWDCLEFLTSNNITPIQIQAHQLIPTFSLTFRIVEHPGI
ncbi:hypothetical protein V8E54_000696 [Elaphomyces granulatus]